MPNPVTNVAMMAGGMVALAYYMVKKEAANGAPGRWRKVHQLKNKPTQYRNRRILQKPIGEEMDVATVTTPGLGIRQWFAENTGDDSKEESESPNMGDKAEDSNTISVDGSGGKFQVGFGRSSKDESSLKDDMENQAGSSEAAFNDQLKDLDDSKKSPKENLDKVDVDGRSGRDEEKSAAAGIDVEKGDPNDHSGTNLWKNLEKASVRAAGSNSSGDNENLNSPSDEITRLDQVNTYDNDDDDDTELTISWPEEATLSVCSRSSKSMNHMFLETELSQTLTACPFLLDAHPRLARDAAMAMAEAVQEWFDAYMADLATQCVDVRKELLEKVEQELTVAFVGRSGLDVGGGGLHRIAGKGAVKPSPPSVLVPSSPGFMPTERAADAVLHSHADDLKELIASRDAALLGKLSATWSYAVNTAMQDSETTDMLWDGQEEVLPFNVRVAWRWRLVEEEEREGDKLGDVVVGLCHA